MILRACMSGSRYVLMEWARGRMSRTEVGMALSVPVIIVGGLCFAYGPDNVLVMATTNNPAVVLITGDGLSEEEREEELARLEEAKKDVRRVGPVTVLAGTAPPSTWSTDQKNASPRSAYELVPLDDGSTRKALAKCLAGHDIGAGGRDWVKSAAYDELELVDAWRIENATLWGKYAAERLQTQAT
eukprot:2334043-Prymnesium_polylepis.1